MYDRLGDLLSEVLETGELPSSPKEEPQEQKAEQIPSPPKQPIFKEKVPKTENKKQYEIIKNFIPNEVKSALAFIGISESAGFDEAKKIYREKLMYYHPDRRNDNPVLQKVAKEKTERLISEWAKIEKWHENPL